MTDVAQVAPKRRRRRSSKRPHGQGTVYKVRATSKTWSISWREAGRRQYKHGFQTEELARAALALNVNEVQRGRAGLPPDPELVPTLAELAKDWLTRREHTHRAWRDDKNRWKRYLEPTFGRLRPHEIDPAAIRKFVERLLAPKPKGSGLAPNTAGNAVRLLSTFYADLVERKLAPSNPVAALPRSTRKLYRPSDPTDTPFLKSTDAVRKVYLALERPDGALEGSATDRTVATAFAIGALAGLRTGEVLALEWGDIDLKTQRIHIRRQARHGQMGVLKDAETRIAPIQDALVPILKAWRLRNGSDGLVIRPAVATRGGRVGSPARFVQIHTLHDALKTALKAKSVKLSGLTWYQATRHTFASLWVLGGGSIERLRDIMGHDSVTTTERYAHLRPGHFAEADYGRLAVDLSRPAGKVSGRIGSQLANRGTSVHSKNRIKSST